MTHTDYAAEARRNSARAAAYTRSGTAYARKAAAEYRQVGRLLVSAAWLTAHPALWDPAHDFTPASRERTARSVRRLADTYLCQAFAADDHAAFYRGLAARYRDMGARYQAQVA